MHKSTKQNVSLGIALTSLLISSITYGGAKWQSKLASPVVAQESVTVTATPIPTVKPTTGNPVEDYINEVFGEYADEALIVLKGKGPGTCAENRHLDPNAFNRNWTKTPGVYWSTDWSIFQINDKFHPVEELNLRTDWKANVRYAFKMFSNDGNSFKRWTCGKVYGL
jgi:hypothetical protein